MLDETNMYAAAEAPTAVTLYPAGSDIRPVPAHPESNDTQIPRPIWRIMFLCYGIFFAGLLAATGRGTEAIFLISICIGYAVMFFGLASILVGLDGKDHHLPAPNRNRVLQTWGGPMSPTAVAGQILTIPVCFALFGIALVGICAWVG